MSAPRYRLNTPTVASKVIDGEAVLIHFTSGNYYSTDQAGASIVERLDGRTEAEVAESLAASYDGEPAAIAEAVRAFVGRLVAEGLAVEADAPPAGPLPEAAPAGPFVAPALQRYADLQDLLVLDPIHDTDEAGWPLTPTEQGG